MERRSFIQSSIVGLGGSLVASNLISIPENSSAQNQIGFISESGIHGKDTHFCLGILLSRDVLTHERNLEDLRGITNFRAKLSYRSNNKYKLNFAKEAIEYFVSQSDIFLAATKKSIAPSQSDRFTVKYLNSEKLNYANDLIGSLSNSDRPTSVLGKYHSMNGPSRGFIEDFNSRTSTSFESKVTHESNLLQLSSFIVSSIMADINGTVKQPVKLELIQYLKNRLNINSFNQNIQTSKLSLQVS